MRLRHANRVVVRKIRIMSKRVTHWRTVYHRYNVIRIAARRLQAKLVLRAKIAARRMKRAIYYQKMLNLRRRRAIHAEMKAIAYKGKQVYLRKRAEKMTRHFKARYSLAIKMGRKHKRTAIYHHK
jgi:hypothetical protein